MGERELRANAQIKGLAKPVRLNALLGTVKAPCSENARRNQAIDARANPRARNSICFLKPLSDALIDDNVAFACDGINRLGQKCECKANLKKHAIEAERQNCAASKAGDGCE